MNLQENIQRIRSMMGLLKEEDQEKEIILIDGTSSAGKSQTAEILKAVKFFKSSDPNRWVQIDSDMFGCEDEQCIQNIIKYDHPCDGPNPQAGEEFHKEMSEKRKGGFVTRCSEPARRLYTAAADGRFQGGFSEQTNAEECDD